jgi:hypothetical protein
MDAMLRCIVLPAYRAAVALGVSDPARNANDCGDLRNALPRPEGATMMACIAI